MRYHREIEVPGDPASVFSYLADLETTAEWDPGIVEARRLSPGPTAIGSRFEVIALFRGKRQRYEYVVTGFEEGRRVAVHIDGDKAQSDDVITVTGEGGSSRVAYDADLRLKGVRRVAEPFLRSALKRLGDDALDGLEATLARRRSG